MSWLTLCILVAQCAVILFSWVVASLFPDLPLRSLLTGSGLRWLFGHITQNMSLPLLVDVMLFCIGAGYAEQRTVAHCRARSQEL